MGRMGGWGRWEDGEDGEDEKDSESCNFKNILPVCNYLLLLHATYVIARAYTQYSYQSYTSSFGVGQAYTLSFGAL